MIKTNFLKVVNALIRAPKRIYQNFVETRSRITQKMVVRPSKAMRATLLELDCHKMNKNNSRNSKFRMIQSENRSKTLRLGLVISPLMKL